LEKRREEVLGLYSQETNCEEEVEKILIDTLDMIEENFKMNASKKEKLVLSKESLEVIYLNEKKKYKI